MTYSAVVMNTRIGLTVSSTISSQVALSAQAFSIGSLAKLTGTLVGTVNK